MTAQEFAVQEDYKTAYGILSSDIHKLIIEYGDVAKHPHTELEEYGILIMVIKDLKTITKETNE